MLPGGSPAAMMAAPHPGPDLELEELLDATAALPCEEDQEEVQDAVPSPARQAQEVEAAEAREITEGDQLYLIAHKWWAEWCAYTRFKQQRQEGAEQQQQDGDGGGGGALPTIVAARAAVSPSEIDNAGIVFADRLRENLEEGTHFVIVTSQSWALLHGWYGGGPPVCRPAVMEGLGPNTKRPRVMLYPMTLSARWGGRPNEIKTIDAEKNESVRSLKERACAAFGVDPSTVELWDFFHNSKYANLEGCMDKDLEGARILDEQPILLDDKANPLPDDKSSSPTFSYASGRPARMSSFQDDSIVARTNGRPGLVGLQNLGNTCFMNSSLQCLMHTVPILRVFLTGAADADINTANPLGLKGQLALALASLTGNVWKADVGSVVPRAFKSKIAQFAPQFSGYQQHDSQEFLGFLLDGLHEDINRIQQKPYVEAPDSEGMPDEQLAALAWANHRLRNDSYIVDHFQGLYKSTLVCPTCSHTSVTFDPFMYLSLPLPESRVRQLTAILLHADGAAPPCEYGLEVPQSGTLKDLYTTLAAAACLPPLVAPEQQMVAAKLRQPSSIGAGLHVHEDARARISELGRDDRHEVLLVYYYADPATGPGGNDGANKRVTVFHRRAGKRGTEGRFSAPLLLWLPASETYDPQLHVVRAAPSASQQRWAGSGGHRLGGADVEYALTDDAPVQQHVRRMLQPFLAPPALRQRPQQQQQEQPLPPPPAAAAAAAEGDAAAAAGAAQQPAGSPGLGDVSMAAASALPGSPTASPEHGATSHPAHASRAAASAAAAATRWSDGGAAADVTNNAAASEGGDNNSTWGSHGSEGAPGSDMDDVPMLAEPDEPAGAGGSGSGKAAAAEDGGSAPPDWPADASIDLLAMDGPADMDEGELAAQAAILAEEEAGGAAADGDDDTAAGSSGPGLLLAGGVPVAPLDMWAEQPQATSAQAAAALAQQEQQDPGSGGQLAPPLQLKLAKDNGDSSSVSSWMANHFHPHIHHFTYILDWDCEGATRLSHADYMAAAVEAAAALGGGEQQPEQQPGAAQQQPLQQQPGSMEDAQQPPPPGQDVEQQQQQPGSFWLPDPVDAARVPQDSDEHTIVGPYTLLPMQSPQQDASVGPIRAARSDPRGKVVSLDNCVEAFLQPEQLGEADEWYCPKCKTHVQADKKLDLWRLPEVLVVHLKRFSYTRWNRDKLDTQVVFPLEGLDLSRYVLPNASQADPALAPLYDCYAVSNHYGGMGGGHYTACAQMPDDKQWYCFDDSRVEDITPDAVQSKAAYLLFYRRRAQAQADPPDLLPTLLAQREHYLAAKAEEEAREAAAAEAAREAEAEAAREAASRAAAGCGGVAADADAAGVQPMDTSGEAAAAAAVEGGGGGLLGVGSPAPPSPPVAMTRLGGRQPGAADSSSTSTSLPAGPAGADDGDSSDGGGGSSSSRPRGGGRRQAADAAAAADAVDSWGALQQPPPGGQQQQQQPQPQPQHTPRQSDQDAEMPECADRDVV